MLEKKSNDHEKGSMIYRDQLITVGDLESFRLTLLEEIKSILREPSGQSNKQWLRSAEVRKLLGVSPGTLQNLRINGSLPFSKVGGIVYYKQEEIFKLLEDSQSR